MASRHPAWVSVLGGAGCLAAGAALGVAWPKEPPPPLFREAEPVRTPVVLPSFADIVERVGPGVVTVRSQLAAAARDETLAAAPAHRLRGVHAGEPGVRSGSGFVVQARGLVVTSRHVVVGATAVDVIVPGRGRFRADVVGEDPATDLALLRVLGVAEDLHALPLGNSAELRAGDWIVAVGNPFGFAQSVTAGVVSFVGRHLSHSDYAVTNDFLQISAPVNPGSSGCPVVDLQGQVVGVTTQAPIDSQGISFAVPSRSVKWVLEAMQRVADGRVRRGYLGIEFATRAGFDDAGSRRTGAVILNVVEGQAAHRAGLRAGDVVLRVDGTPVADARALHERIVCAEPGTPIALQLLRDGLIEDSIVAVLGEAATARRTDSPN